MKARAITLTIAALVVGALFVPVANGQSVSQIGWDRWETAITTDANAIATLVSGDSAAVPGVQLAQVETDLTAIDADLENAAGASGTIEVNAAIIEAQTGAYTGVSTGTETANSAPIAWTVVDSAGNAVDENKTFIVSLQDNSDASLLLVSAWTITCTTGTPTSIDGGTTAIYGIVSSAAGVVDCDVNDVAGGSGVTVRVTATVLDGNTVYLESPPAMGNIVFD